MTLRFFAIHDPDGNISSLVGSPSTGPVMKPIQLAMNQLFTEVKLPPRLFDPANAASYRRLTEIATSYRLAMPPSKPAKLVKKSQGEPKASGRLESLAITPNPVTRSQVPRFDVTLREAAAAVVNVVIVLDPNTFVGSIAIPQGQRVMALSWPIPANIPPGPHVVSARVGPDDTVSAELTLKA